MYPRAIAKREAIQEIESEIYYTPAEMELLRKQDFYDDQAIDEELENAINYIPDFRRNLCGVCGKDSDPSCKYEC